MNPHDHDHAHGDEHHHGHEAHQHHEPAATSSTSLSKHRPHRHPPEQGNVEPFGGSLLMSSSWRRVLGASALIALLWLAVAWAVLFID